MTKTYTYTPMGVCARMFEITTEDGIIRNVTVYGGCHGNSQGVASLLVGMSVSEAISRLRGIDCHGKGTSCPDQLSYALEQAL
ncbi:MAG: TIGR03905 family TSCPD domain-containing protein [Rikenellaceae bacterium]|nr:TIGR03905 family TSCPD domain-containing protein [Rikenellaceae bacterium]